MINGFETNKDILKELGSRLKAERIEMGLTQKEFSKKAGISTHTLINIENGEECTLSNFLNVLRALQLLSNIDLLIPEALINPFEVDKMGKVRQRVRKRKEENVKWVWGDEK